MSVNNLVCVSDTHIGDALGLMSHDGALSDDGQRVSPSDLQRIVWDWWTEFWEVSVPEMTTDEPYMVCHLGDAIDGVKALVETWDRLAVRLKTPTTAG